MTPPHTQLHVLPAVSAGAPFTVVMTAPGTHGAGVLGTHGIGVSTPIAAAVAAMTVGFAGDEHIPNGGMFAIGRWSIVVSGGRFSTTTGAPFGTAMSDTGETPNEHCAIADVTTLGIGISGLRSKGASP
jgi:hypothetical protein